MSNVDEKPGAQMTGALPQVVPVRHGETAWTISRQHTGHTDIPLTGRDEREAQALGARLKGMSFVKVCTSPLQWARRTGELAGFAERAQADPGLMGLRCLPGQEHGRYRTRAPRLAPWARRQSRDETLAAVGAPANRVIGRVREARPLAPASTNFPDVGRHCNRRCREFSCLGVLGLRAARSIGRGRLCGVISGCARNPQFSQALKILSFRHK
jgi:hypothetical protein